VAYRRTGADPPFGDPRRAHGVALEGYYWRFADAASGRVVVALCGACRAPGGPWAVVTLAAHPGGFVRTVLTETAWRDPDGLGVTAGSALRATPARLSVDLGPEARLDVALEGRREWPRRVWGGLGPAQAVPGLPQYWHPHLFGATVTGGAVLGEEAVDLGGFEAYAEKNWGGSFPGEWWWGQAGGDAGVAFAGGRLGGRLAATAWSCAWAATCCASPRRSRWSPPAPAAAPGTCAPARPATRSRSRRRRRASRTASRCRSPPSAA
jgi:hypothetical protein